MSKNQNDQLSNFYKTAGIDYEIFNFSQIKLSTIIPKQI